MMVRLLAPYLIGAFAVMAVIGGAIYIGVSWERDRRAADDARDYIEGTQDADKATDDVRRDGACNWLRKTFGGEGCGADGQDAPAD